jgi:hypothetical protein
MIDYCKICGEITNSDACAVCGDGPLCVDCAEECALTHEDEEETIADD